MIVRIPVVTHTPGAPNKCDDCDKTCCHTHTSIANRRPEETVMVVRIPGGVATHLWGLEGQQMIVMIVLWAAAPTD
jgi:hypothetical protein